MTRSRFRYFWTLFTKCFAPFDQSTCALSVSCQYLCLARDIPRYSSCSSKKLYSLINGIFLSNWTNECFVCNNRATGLSPSFEFHSRTFFSNSFLIRKFDFDFVPFSTPRIIAWQEPPAIKAFFVFSCVLPRKKKKKG